MTDLELLIKVAQVADIDYTLDKDGQMWTGYPWFPLTDNAHAFELLAKFRLHIVYKNLPGRLYIEVYNGQRPSVLQLVDDFKNIESYLRRAIVLYVAKLGETC